VGRPFLLILDEPLAPLDIRTQQSFLRDLRDIVRSSSAAPSVVISSQHIFEVETIADFMLCLQDDGDVWFCGALNALSDSACDHAFEVSGDIEASIDDLSSRFGSGCVVARGGVLLVRVPRSFSASDILALFHQHREAPQYFRDISNSAMRLFWQT